MAFAAIGFALKCGFVLGSSSFLCIMVSFFNYDAAIPEAPTAIHEFRICSGLVVALLLLISLLLLSIYKLDKRTTIAMAHELTARRKQV